MIEYGKQRGTAAGSRPLWLAGLFALMLRVHGADAPATVIPKLKSVPVCAALATAAKSNAIPIGQFDSPSETNTLNPGDSATVLVTFFQKEKQTQWLLYIEAAPPDPNEKPKKTSIKMAPVSKNPIIFESEPTPAKLRLLGPYATDAKSAPSKSRAADARVTLEKDFLSLGLDRAAALALKWDQTTNAGNAPPAFKPTPAEQRIYLGQFPALFSFVSVVMQTEGLNTLFFKLVELPSVWSMVRHLGLNLNILHDGRPALANPADWNLPASADVYYYPWQVQLNDKPALKITLVVTSPHPPLLICSGVVGILAEKTGDDQTYMTLRVVNAHRN